MKQKANKSLEAAQSLINTRETYGYNSSVHCSYYTVLQYMKYILAKTDRRPLAYNEQNSSSQSSHDFVIEEIVNRIKKSTDGRDFAQQVRRLKKQRVDADYTDRNFTEDESLGCKENAVGAISKLKRYFGDL